LLAFKLTPAGAIAPALHWQGRGRRPRPLPASPCAASAPYPHQLPSRVRALWSHAGCQQTSVLFALRSGNDVALPHVWRRPRGQPPRVPPRPWIGASLKAKPDAIQNPNHRDVVRAHPTLVGTNNSGMYDVHDRVPRRHDPRCDVRPSLQSTVFSRPLIRGGYRWIPHKPGSLGHG
jgi:hypothetical protein